MSRTGTVRQYGKQTRKPRAERLFAELPQSPVRRTPRKKLAEDGDVGKLSKLVAAVKIDDEEGDEVDVQAHAGSRASRRGTRQVGAEREDERESHEDGKEVAVAQPESPAEAVGKRKLRTKGRKGARVEVEVETPQDRKGETTTQERESPGATTSKRRSTRKKSTKNGGAKTDEHPQDERETAEAAAERDEPIAETEDQRKPQTQRTKGPKTEKNKVESLAQNEESVPEINEPEQPAFTADDSIQTGLRTLSWDDVCAFPDTITKIAEASYAEVYRVTNARGTSIIKVIRLTSPIKAQTKAQERSGLVDEEPHDVGDLLGELRVSEWVADIPGFVVYKDRYVVRGKAPKALVETHQAFQRKAKRADPDRLQFYPSPSRYLEDTSFLVVELGDAGTALEDFALERADQVWDIFLLVAIALARAEDLILFEHRDLHEGNLCIRQVTAPRDADTSQPDVRFGRSGLDITILDYGLSRAEDPHAPDVSPVAYDLEKDLSIFTSTHAAQCAVYRQMRSFLLRGDRVWLPPKAHATPRALAFDGLPLDWTVFAPYTNVLWLAYTYAYLVEHFGGAKKELTAFRRETREMWGHLDPVAKAGVPCFGSAGDVVRFAVESGWVLEEQVVVEGSTLLEREDSIMLMVDDDEGARVRRSPRRKQV